MKLITAVLIMMFPSVATACGPASQMGGCGGGHAGHGAASHESHTQDAKSETAGVPTRDPDFDAARTQRMMDAYAEIVVALAADKVAGIEGAAAIVAKEGPNGRIREAAAVLVKATGDPDITQIRERFKPLSAAVVWYVAGNYEALEAAAERDKREMARKAYCPMADAPWLQSGEKITNPFYGASMLRCGEFQDWAADS